MITMQEMEPLAYCMVTQQMFDRRFRMAFCDNTLLRERDMTLEPELLRMKREMNSGMTERKYLEGHKANILNNLDRIVVLVARYAKSDVHGTEAVMRNGKEMMRKVLAVESFDELSSMDAEFKTKILLAVYELYSRHSKMT
ncbi:MAG: hypothetical protein NT016_01400 [Candidatus Aenigmarchaeota archaeon]|nr:hypothetical protein [Candidatus Aenigmarchaeota archaeon]